MYNGQIQFNNMINAGLVLNFILNRFLIVFLLVLTGAFVHDIYDTMKNLTPISVKRIFVSSMFASLVMSAVAGYVQIEIGIFALICFIVGAWGFKLLEVVMNWKIVKKLLTNILKNSKNTIANSISDTIEDVSKDTEKESSNKEINNKEKEDDS